MQGILPKPTEDMTQYI